MNIYTQQEAERLSGLTGISRADWYSIIAEVLPNFREDDE